MPAGNDRFADAVKPALEALLSDLKHTTEVLQRSNISDRRSEVRDDIEPIYQEQTRRSDYRLSKSPNGSMQRSYDNSLNRQYQNGNRYSSQDPISSRKSLGNAGTPSNAQSYHDVRSDGRASSKDGYHSEFGTMNNSEISSKHGINTIPKGDCAQCGKPIIGQVVIALGKMWHPEHYTCCECGTELGHRPFFERAGRAYCEEDYHIQFSPKCNNCNGPIKDRCVSALNKNFHIECFVCCECGREFGEDGFHEKNGQTYCKRDFFRLYAPKCNGCQQPITSNFISALGTHWHPDCFVCQSCGLSFDGGSFFEHNGAPLCERHYHEARGSLCSHCRAPINGRCVAAMGRKYHPEHFRCSYCNQQLTKGTFKEVDRRPFCHKCYNNTFALTPA